MYTSDSGIEIAGNINVFNNGRSERINFEPDYLTEEEQEYYDANWETIDDEIEKAMNKVDMGVNENKDTEDKGYEYYMAKEKIDDETIKWITSEFDLKPETVIPIANISKDPSDLYDTINNIVDEKGYGFDSVENEEELDDEDYDGIEFESKKETKHIKLFENFTYNK